MIKICPQCNKEIDYKSVGQYNESVKYNRTCRACASRRRGYKGVLDKICVKCGGKHTFSSYRKYKISKTPYICKSCVLSLIHKGKHISEEHKEILRIKHLGTKASNETKKKLSDQRKGKLNSCYGRSGDKNPMFGKSGELSPTYGKSYNKGKKMSDEARKNMRIAKLKRFEKLGIQSGEDEGAKEWFLEYNKKNKTNFKPKRFFEIGYDADGYDEEKHIWIEYDTHYHNIRQQKEKDLIRQQNIIKYFENIERPLNQFIRVDSTKNSEIKIVYEKMVIKELNEYITYK